eukprot:CAMPEP_0197646592 /NCGR_PEP_ID=MMETSP1338-20131121/23743_1 /TAXON_ID=43686 ORGANISM="Pelagodinium beii, Strain RCC1491" /NCGR_SAMPLE_ID=MMETSP1338 /ASSEMBLY_ACC=CAM_ASM_000754 /LENGTH=126 /DNA_ID=CAMNT_0043220243 /DNA_START=65 /DNA_END=442 /DNA_ORIENTATION=+
MARALAVVALLLNALVAFADELGSALNTDDACLAKGEDCGLELLQAKGQATAEEYDDNEEGEEVEDVDEDTENVEVGRSKHCFTKIDNAKFKSGGAKSFNAALEHCGRSCAAGFPCTKSCMHKAGY